MAGGGRRGVVGRAVESRPLLSCDDSQDVLVDEFVVSADLLFVVFRRRPGHAGRDHELEDEDVLRIVARK